MWKAEGRGQEIRMSDTEGGDISDGVRLRVRGTETRTRRPCPTRFSEKLLMVTSLQSKKKPRRVQVF